MMYPEKDNYQTRRNKENKNMNAFQVTLTETEFDKAWKAASKHVRTSITENANMTFANLSPIQAWYGGDVRVTRTDMEEDELFYYILKEAFEEHLTFEKAWDDFHT